MQICKLKIDSSSNPDAVLERLKVLIEASYIDEEGLTAEIARLAARGIKFGPVCMDDVTPLDR